MKTAQMTQGSDDWHAHRAKHYNASDAPAMMGVSKYMKRDDLVALYATGVMPEIDEYTQKIFDDGHRFEALARPLAEDFIGEELSPVIATEGEYSASLDGATFAGTINFEHKSLNDEIRNCTAAADLHMMYRVQMEHQNLCSPSTEKTLFMASCWDDSDQLIDKRWFWYEPDLALRQRIIDGWAQFAEDVKNYKAPEPTKTVVGDPVAVLPMPAVIAEGKLVQSNIGQITPRFDAYLAGVNTELTTDQHFADATENAKTCRIMAKKLRSVADSVIAQMSSVAEVDSILRQYEKKMDAMGLQLEKLVKAEKEAIKQRAIVNAQTAYKDHCDALEVKLDGLEFPCPPPEFGAAIKGVRTVESMQSRINDALAAGKAEATRNANELTAKLAFIREAIKGNEHLFNVQLLIANDTDHIKLQITTAIDAEQKRIAEKVAEAKKADEHKEAQIKADAEAAKQREAERKEAERLAPIRLRIDTIKGVLSIAPTLNREAIKKALNGPAFNEPFDYQEMKEEADSLLSKLRVSLTERTLELDELDKQAAAAEEKRKADEAAQIKKRKQEIEACCRETFDALRPFCTSNAATNRLIDAITVGNIPHVRSELV